MIELRYPVWQEPYQKALIETRQEKFAEKFHLAEAAIFSRMTEMPIVSETRHEAESLTDALRALDLLKREAMRSKKRQGLVDQPSQLSSQTH